jgi:hypothetical protein
MLVRDILARRHWNHYGNRFNSKQSLASADLLKPLSEHNMTEDAKPPPEHVASNINFSAMEEKTTLQTHFNGYFDVMSKIHI